MKPVVTAKDFEYNTDDIDYHLREAHRLRSEYIGNMITGFAHALTNSVKGFLGRMSFHKVKHA